MNNILKVENLNFSYGQSQILSNVSVEFEQGKVHAIIGQSGSGKTTLLSVISGISTYKNGQILYKGQPVNKSYLKTYRQKTNVIFQDFNLIFYLSAIQNIIVALDITNFKGDKKSKAKELLQTVGIPEKDWNRACAKLSGGQQQRVAIARALATDSEIIFADEPTGNLDSKTRKDITALLCKMAWEYNKCVICVTHDTQFKNLADVVFTLRDGVLAE